ncbi:MAG: hypothetical protein M1371_00250 [Actinobacteria bacterium]|nr:hypothetical protein [Actinomycetota bacterium]
MSVNITFVCTGNTCRSFIAEAIARHLMNEKYPAYRDYVRIRSVGTLVEEKSEVSKMASQALKESDILIPDMEPSQINQKIIDESDILLVMSVKHKQHICKRYRDACDKSFLVKAFAAMVDDFANDLKDERTGMLFNKNVSRKYHNTSNVAQLQREGSSTQGDKTVIEAEVKSLARIYALINNKKFKQLESSLGEDAALQVKYEVPDPIGMELDTYIGVVKELTTDIETIFDFLFAG